MVAEDEQAAPPLDWLEELYGPFLRDQLAAAFERFRVGLYRLPGRPVAAQAVDADPGCCPACSAALVGGACPDCEVA